MITPETVNPITCECEVNADVASLSRGRAGYWTVGLHVDLVVKLSDGRELRSGSRMLSLGHVQQTGRLPDRAHRDAPAAARADLDQHRATSGRFEGGGKVCHFSGTVIIPSD